MGDNININIDLEGRMVGHALNLYGSGQGSIARSSKSNYKILSFRIGGKFNEIKNYEFFLRKTLLRGFS